MMTQWREKVARAMIAADSGPEGSKLFEIHWEEFADGYRKGADAAIAELLPLVKAELAKVAAGEMRKQGHDIDPPSVIAAIEAWEPQHD